MTQFSLKDSALGMSDFYSETEGSEAAGSEAAGSESAGRALRLPKRRLNRSTRPLVSAIFCLPV